MTAATLLIRADQDRPLVADATVGAPAPAVDDLPDNVRTWDDVADLPWAEAFDMACPPAPVAEPERRRRTDTRSLADVVREVAA